jgi:hypothetical protein
MTRRRVNDHCMRVVIVLASLSSLYFAYKVVF